jgi:predicted N-acyltransferase
MLNIIIFFLCWKYFSQYFIQYMNKYKYNKTRGYLVKVFFSHFENHPQNQFLWVVKMLSHFLFIPKIGLGS